MDTERDLVGSHPFPLHDLGGYYLMQMSLAQDEEKVQALSSHTAQKALADGIGLGRTVRRLQHVNSDLSGPKTSSVR